MYVNCHILQRLELRPSVHASHSEGADIFGYQGAKCVLMCGVQCMGRTVPVGLLICTLISENQGLENLRSVSNLRKISGPAHLDFFKVYGINLAFFLGGDLEKYPGLQDQKFSKV